MAAQGTVVFRQTKKTEHAGESVPLKEAIEDSNDPAPLDHRKDYYGNSSTTDRSPHRRRNYWFVSWIVPVLFVLFSLPIQEEAELEGGAIRAELSERVSVLASNPGDFVVHAASHQRWSYQFKKPFKPSSSGNVLSSSQAPCIRMLGLNETLNAFPDMRKKLPRIKYIRIVGERNSGTRLLHLDLQKSLRNLTIESGVTRWGYWFQDATLLNPMEHKPEETLVIHIVVDPYEWFARMLANPIHAPYHRKLEGASSNWTAQTFFKRPWTCPRPDWDDTRPAQGHCQYRFPYDAVIPCLAGKNTGVKANKNYPVYEMHPTKLTPFPTVVHLRTAKLRNFLNITSWMPHVIHVRARDVAGLSGFNTFVSALLDRYRLSVACEVHKRDPIKPGSTSVHDKTNGETLSWTEFPPEPLTSWQIRFITCNLDWDVEREVGFLPREDLHTACPHGFVGHNSKKDTKVELQPGTGDGEEKNILFRFMDGLSSNFGRRRVSRTESPSNRHRHKAGRA